MSDDILSPRAAAPSGAKPRSARSVSARDLRAQCEAVAKSCVVERKATREDLEPYKPGGARNPATGAPGWLRYLVVLHRTHASGRVAGAMTAAATDAERDAADRVVLDALRAEPITVRTASGAPLAVHPKSLDAYMHLHALDVQLAYLCAQRETLAAMATPRAMELHERVLAAISFTYQLLAWIVTTPGPALPYDPSASEPPVPPPHIANLDPLDFMPLSRAFQQHATRLAAVRALIDASRVGEVEDGPPGMRSSWSLFIASAADTLGADAVVLMRDRALVTLLAQMQIAAAAKAPPKRDDTTE